MCVSQWISGLCLLVSVLRPACRTLKPEVSLELSSSSDPVRSVKLERVRTCPRASCVSVLMEEWRGVSDSAVLVDPTLSTYDVIHVSRDVSTDRNRTRDWCLNGKNKQNKTSGRGEESLTSPALVSCQPARRRSLVSLCHSARGSPPPAAFSTPTPSSAG